MNNLLRQIQELTIIAIDLNLFLDTHPDDKRALKDYNCCVDLICQLQVQLEEESGPLANFGVSSSDFPWQWAQTAFPWD